MVPTETLDQAQGRPLVKVHSERSILDFVLVLARHKRFILGFTMGAALLTVITVLLISNKYTATTIVLPPAQTSGMGSALLSQLSAGAGGAGALASLAGGSLGIKNPGEMYVAFFRGRTVEDAMIQRFGLKARYRTKTMFDTRLAFEKHSTVVLGLKDGLIRINVEDRDPKLAAEIANGYVDEFKKLSATLAITEASQRRLFFQQQLQEAQSGLTDAEEAMKSTEISTGVLQVDSQAKALIEAASLIRAQIVAKQVQIQAMRSFATEDNPELQIAKQQVSALQTQLGKLAGKDSDEFIVSKGRAPEAGMEYLRKFRDLKYRETVYELIAKQFEMAKLDEARQGSIVQVADVAVPPDKKSSPHRALIVVLVTMLAFCGAYVWCILAEGFQRMKANPAERERIDALRATFR